METIFDLATPEEIRKVFGYPLNDADYEFNRRCFLESADYNFRRLASLYSIRGDIQTAESYVARIQDPEYRLDAHFSLHSCTP